MTNKLMIEHVADALMEHIPSNMNGIFNPDDPGNYKWARAQALVFAEEAIKAINSYKDSKHG